MIRLVTLLLLVHVLGVEAQQIRGLSVIGACSPRFPCDTIIDLQPAGIGYLADAFGHRCSCVRRLIEQESLRYVRVHIANGTCFPERGRVCGAADVFKGETQVSAEAKVLQGDQKTLRRYRQSVLRSKNLLSGFQGQKRYSLMLESPFSTAARRRLLREAGKYLNQEEIVDSVISQKCLKNLICERHGDAPKFTDGVPCIADTDGISYLDADIDRLNSRAKGCEAIFCWTHFFNLLPYGYSGRFLPPITRGAPPGDEELLKVGKCLGSSFMPQL